MIKQQINAIAMSLKFPYDHSKGEVKDLEKLVKLVNCALDSELCKRINEQNESKKILGERVKLTY